MKNSVLLTTITAVLTLAACNSRNDDVTDADPPDAPRSNSSAPALVDAQEPKAPCDWLTRQEVEETLGSLAGEPYLVSSAESVRQDPSGLACAYPLTTQRGIVDLAVQVDLDGAPGFETSSDIMAGVIAREMSEDGHGEASKVEPRSDGWDFASWVAGARLYRVGHVAILIGDRASVIKDELLDGLAQRVRAKIIDKPFANPRRNVSSAGSSPDPCDLLTRAEAETVLGPLAVAPYRSLKASVLADNDGPSCTYYAPGHHTLVVQPTYSDGKESFAMVAGLGSLMRSGIGGADEGDLLDGPWDSATAGSNGELLFLAGDRMLKIIYNTSTTNIEGAAKLAAIATPRLSKQ